jgi:hypothetical protein
VVETGGDPIVYIATHYDDSGTTRGRVRILEVGSTSTSIKATRNIPAPVFAIAVAANVKASGWHTVLIGTACDKLYRFDIDSPYTAFGTPTADVSGLGFLRDIVIHRAGTGDDRAYVAAWSSGVFGFDVTGTALSSLSGSWPLRPGLYLQPGVVHPTDSVSLTLEPTTARLAIGLSGAYYGELQYGGDCEKLVACTRSLGAPDHGKAEVQVWDVSAASSPQHEVSYSEIDDINMKGVMGVGIRIVERQLSHGSRGDGRRSSVDWRRLDAAGACGERARKVGSQ